MVLFDKMKSIVNTMCESEHGHGMVATQQQRQMPVVDDDQRHSTLLLLGPLILGRLLEGRGDG